MNNTFFTQSKNFLEEYSARIVVVDDIKPIEGKDKICLAVVAGMEVIVGKTEVNKGDILIYCPIETVINPDFLRLNNLYENPKYNADATKKGYFNNLGRVRILKLGNTYSMGFLTKSSALSLITKHPMMEDLSEYVGTSFDTIDGVNFIHVYVPEDNSLIKETTGDSTRKLNKKLHRYNQIIPGTFSFHYETRQLNANIGRIQPTDIITITEKLHGTSAIFANIPVNCKLNIFQHICKFFGKKYEKYDIIYSSRKVIKNKYINKTQGPGFYCSDTWGYLAEKLNGAIPKDCTIYGECVGYNPGTTKAIQAVGGHIYTYGCAPRECKLMIYRVKFNGKELNVRDVFDYSNTLSQFSPSLQKLLLPINIFYQGPAAELYPDIKVDDNWHVNLLERLKQDKTFYMEQDEPTCPKGTPAEGIVLRINDDPMAEAFKLKCLKFLDKEAKDIDKGIVDAESAGNYSKEA